MSEFAFNPFNFWPEFFQQSVVGAVQWLMSLSQLSIALLTSPGEHVSTRLEWWRPGFVEENVVSFLDFLPKQILIINMW